MQMDRRLTLSMLNLRKKQLVLQSKGMAKPAIHGDFTSMDKIGGENRTITLSDGPKDGPGRGKKLCPHCNRYIGVVSKICKLCGSDLQEGIVKPKKPVTSSTDKEERKSYFGRGSYVLCPGGQSLQIGLGAKLKSLDPEEIASWADKVLGLGESHGINYSPTALRYFLRYFYDINSKEYQVAKNHLNEWSQSHFARNEDSCDVCS